MKAIRTRSVPSCPLCSGAGEILYAELEDHFFKVPSRWTLRECMEPGCRLVWLDPRPSLEDIAKTYLDGTVHENPDATRPRRSRLKKILRESWKVLRAPFLLLQKPLRALEARFRPAWEAAYLHHRYDIGPFASPWAAQAYHLWPEHRAHTDMKLMHLVPKSGKRLLEVGCGNGWLLEFLQDRGWMAEGIDFDPLAVEAARKRGLKVHQGELSEQSFEASSFHAIAGNHLLEHLVDPKAFLKECFRLLEPGGQCTFLTPNSKSLGRRIFGSHWSEWEPPRHIQIFNPLNLRKLAEELGFEIVELRTSARDAHLLFHSSRCTAQKHRIPAHVSMSPMRAAWTRCLQRIEWWGLHLGLAWGEEIVLRLRKP